MKSDNLRHCQPATEFYLKICLFYCGTALKSIGNSGEVLGTTTKCNNAYFLFYLNYLKILIQIYNVVMALSHTL